MEIRTPRAQQVRMALADHDHDHEYMVPDMVPGVVPGSGYY